MKFLMMASHLDREAVHTALNLPETGWETLARTIGGEREGEVRPLVRRALETLAGLGVGTDEGIWIQPAYDGQFLSMCATRDVHAV
jgi:electron transfer flavoprotein alpha/beta subunit